VDGAADLDSSRWDRCARSPPFAPTRKTTLVAAEESRRRALRRHGRSEVLVAEPDEKDMIPGRRDLVARALCWPACLLARASAQPTGTASGRGHEPREAAETQSRGGPDPDSLPLTVEDRVYLAVSRFAEGFHCSQSVLATYAGAGLSETAALRMGAALAGGSTVGGECGAVAAGYLVLGLRHGGTVPVFGEVERERELFDRVRRFVAEFRKRHGAITCRELLGVDVFTREGLAEGRRRGLFRERCPRYIRDALTILESLEGDPGSAPGSASGNRR
jgi:C_GCAxxG_C_C family probable redox protein